MTWHTRSYMSTMLSHSHADSHTTLKGYTMSDLLPIRVTDVSGAKQTHQLSVESVIALDNARLARRAIRAGIVGADDVGTISEMHREDKHTGLEARRADMSRMRDALVNGKGLARNGMLRALTKGI